MALELNIHTFIYNLYYNQLYQKAVDMKYIHSNLQNDIIQHARIKGYKAKSEYIIDTGEFDGQIDIAIWNSNVLKTVIEIDSTIQQKSIIKLLNCNCERIWIYYGEANPYKSKYLSRYDLTKIQIIRLPPITKKTIQTRLNENIKVKQSSSLSLVEGEKNLIGVLKRIGPTSPSDQMLLDEMGVTRSRLSQLFGSLQKKGVVSYRREGKKRIYSLTESSKR